MASEGEEHRRSALMAAAQAGNGAAYAALLRLSVPIIRGVGRGRGLTPDAADELVQEVLLTLHRVRHTYDPSRPFTPWLRAIAERRAIDAMRRHGRRREVHDPERYAGHADPAANAERQADLGERTRLLADAVEALPAGQRDAVERLAFREQSLAEAAEETGRSKVALKVNLHRALKTLRARLAGIGES